MCVCVCVCVYLYLTISRILGETHGKKQRQKLVKNSNVFFMCRFSTEVNCPLHEKNEKKALVTFAELHSLYMSLSRHRTQLIPVIILPHPFIFPPLFLAFDFFSSQDSTRLYILVSPVFLVYLTNSAGTCSQVL